MSTRVYVCIVYDWFILSTGLSYVEALWSDPAGRETAKEGQRCLNPYIATVESVVRCLGYMLNTTTLS